MFRTKRSRLMGLVIMLSMMLVAVMAYALVEPKHVSLELRTAERDISAFPIPSATEVTAGTNNVVAATSSLHDAGTYDGGDSGLLGYDAGAKTVTTGLFNPAVPSQLAIVLVDVSGNSTLTCTSVTITGKNAWGRGAVETVSTVSETVKHTTTAFSSVSQVVQTGCGGGASDTDDYLRVAGSAKLALPIKARQVGDIINVCIEDKASLDAGTPQTKCYTGARLSTLGAVSLTYQVVDLLDTDIAAELIGAGSGTGIVTNDGIHISVRPDPALP